jgi:hypothetical protein
MVARPSRIDLAITSEPWDIAPTATGVRTIEVTSKTKLQVHHVLTPQGHPAHGVPVFAQSSATPLKSFTNLDPNSSLQPSNATAVTDANGGFALALDLGHFDVFVRPPGDTGLPWLVEPRLFIDDSPDLGELRISHPIVLVGQVVTPEEQPSPIAGAIIRAWLPLADAYTSDGEGPTFSTAIQIGETTADSQGRYRLLLPPSISQ